MEDKSVNQLSVIRDRMMEFGKLIYEFSKKYFENFLVRIRTLKGDKQITEIIIESLKRFKYYLKIWYMMSRNSFLIVLSQKKVLLIFLTGKILRFIFFTTFIYYLVKGTDTLAGYTVYQVIFFYLTFNVIEVISQFLYREVYRFRHFVVSGDLDLVLTKPVSTLFRVLMGGADVIDLITIPPLLIAVVYIGKVLDPTLLYVAYYILLVINGIIIATSFYIAVLALAIITLEIDHTVMIFRDLGNLGRLPVDIYKQPLRGILTYIIPIGLMITIPAKALMGLITPFGVLFSFSLGITAITLSVRFWNLALRKYTSASS